MTTSANNRTPLLILLLFFCCQLNATITGSWRGKLSVQGIHLTIILNFEKQGDSLPVCTMDSPDQGARGIPAVVNFLSADSINISIPKLYINYKGHYDESRIDGEFSQGMLKMPLILHPDKTEVVRPQMPQPPYPYIVEEVSFPNPDAGISLGGSLVVPGADLKSFKGPIVVMVTGSGRQNRDEELMGHKPFLVIADYLARHNIASLRYDDRGEGASGGDFEQATTADFKTDAAAAIDWLRRKKNFSKVGVLGHSEGGTIAYMLAADGTVDFAISLAGAAISGDSVLLFQNRELLRPVVGDSIADNYCRALTEIFPLAVDSDRNTSQIEADRMVESVLSRKNISLPSSLKTNLSRVITSMSANPWMKHFIGYDPKDGINRIKIPVFAAMGSKDTQVPPKINCATLSRHLMSNGSIIKVYPDLNHLFQHAATGLPQEYGTISETISPAVLADIAAFINNVK